MDILFTPETLIAVVVGYFMGSIPFGLILTRLAGLGDVRDIGSGNIGATNVLRTGNKGLAAATLLLDAGKAAAAVLIVRYFVPFPEMVSFLAGMAAFIGHLFPVWLRFKGGKGVAAYIGVMLATNWIVGLLFCFVWLFLAWTRKFSSLAAMTAAATAPIFAFIWSGVELAAIAALMSVLLIYKHQPNIRRLIEGTEPRIGEDDKASQ
jgi:glycerol-3-phosphate acyltransferase PlsY